MKDTLKMGAKIFGKIILANILCIITVISLSFIVTILFTEDIGYQAIGTTSDSSESEILYEYYYDDGEDTKLAEYEEQGYTVSKATIRSQVSGAGNAFFLILCALFCMSLGGLLIYQYVWKEGNKDFNLVKFGHAKEQKFKGVAIGFIAASPYLLLLVVLAIGKWAFAKAFPVVLYQYINSVFYALTRWICGNTITFGELKIWQILLLLLVELIIPAFCGVAYYLGYKDILVSEKIIYKKQK